MLQRADGGRLMLAVIGADGNAVQLGFLIEHFLVVHVDAGIFDAEFLCEGFRSAGNDIAQCDDVDVVAALICVHVGMGDAARADDADL